MMHIINKGMKGLTARILRCAPETSRCIHGGARQVYQEDFGCVKSKAIVRFDQILVDDVEDPSYQVAVNRGSRMRLINSFEHERSCSGQGTSGKLKE